MKKKSNTVKIVIFAALGLAAAATVLVFFFLVTDVSAVGYEKLPGTVKTVTKAYECTFFDSAGNRTETLSNIHRSETNSLGSMLALGTDGSLYLARESGVTKLDTGVSGSHIFALAESSDTAFYEKNKKIYRNSGSPEQIGELTGFDKFITVSPDGSAAVWGESVRNEMKIYACRGGVTEELSGADSVFAVSGSGLVYGQGGGMLMTCAAGSDKFEAVCGCGTVKAFSADRTQILFTDGTPPATFVFDSVSSSRIPVFNGTVKPFTPAGMKQEHDGFDLFIGEAVDHTGASVNLMQFERNGSEYRTRKFLDLDKVSSYTVSADGRKLLYIRDSKLAMKGTAGSFAKETVIADKVFDFFATPELGSIYFRDTEYRLWWTDGGAPVKISLDAGAVCMAADGVCTFASGGSLYWSENGTAPALCSGISTVRMLSADYAVSDDSIKYITCDGKNYINTHISL